VNAYQKGVPKCMLHPHIRKGENHIRKGENQSFEHSMDFLVGTSGGQD